MSINLTCESSAKSHLPEVNSSQTALEFYDGGGFDRTYIDNGVLTTVDPSVISSCESLYDDVFTCLANESSRSTQVQYPRWSDCGSGQTIYFDLGQRSDPTATHRALRRSSAVMRSPSPLEVGTDWTGEDRMSSRCWVRVRADDFPDGQVEGGGLRGKVLCLDAGLWHGGKLLVTAIQTGTVPERYAES